MVTQSSVSIADGLIESSQSTITILDDEGRSSQEVFITTGEKSALIYKFGYKCNQIESFDQYQMSQGVERPQQFQQSFFNDSCKLVKVVWIDSTKKVTETELTIYDKLGKKVKEVTTDSSNKVTAILNYTYFDNVTEVKGTFGDGSFWYHSQDYVDAKGHNIKTVSIEKDGTKSQTTVEYVYNDHGLILTEKHFDNDNKLTSTTEYQYNADGFPERAVSKYDHFHKSYETITLTKYRKKD